MNRNLGALGAIAFALGACSSSALSPSDGATTAGMCSADVPPGQACNAVVDVVAMVTPTCVTGAMPVGKGGTIVDGIYKLSSQTYYNVMGCPTTPLSNTIEIAGDCLQSVTGSPIVLTASSTIVVQGTNVNVSVTCVSDGMLPLMADAPTKTFTATATTLTFFSLNSAVGNPNPDRVEVFTKR
jgi:hypothetical protein